VSPAGDCTPPDPKTLLRETAWVRRLAASLVADRDLAEDVAQEAMVAAWRSAPPPEARRRWLGAVVKRLAGRVRRARHRRAQRELVAARPEALPSTAELATQAELQRSAVAAVLALAEPHRGTLLLRFVHGAGYAAIASQQGVTVEAVRSRIKRGLAMARARLDREHGSRAAWAAPLLGARWQDTAHGVLQAGVVMGSVKKVGVAVAAGLVAWMAWVGLQSDQQPDRSAPSIAEGIAALGPGATPGPPPPAPPARTTAEPAREPLAPAAPALTVKGRVLCEEANTPLAARIEVRSFGGSEPPVVTAVADRDGRFAVGLRPEQVPLAQFVAVGADDHAVLHARLEPRPRGEPTATTDLGDLHLPVGMAVAGRVVDDQGAPVGGAALYLAQGDTLAGGRRVGETRADGSFALAERVAPDDFRRSNDVGVRAFLVAVAESGIGWVELDPTRRRSARDDVLVQLTPSAALKVRVRGADGEPIAGALVRATPRFLPLCSRYIPSDPHVPALSHMRAVTDVEGNAWLRGLPVCAAVPLRDEHAAWLGGTAYLLTAYAKGYARWEDDHRKLDPGVNEIEVTMVDVPGRVVIAGRVLDRDGKPIAGAVVGHPAAAEGCTTQGDGRFTHATEVQARPGAVTLRARASGHATAFARIEVAGDARALTHDFTLAPGSAVTGRVLDETGAPVAGCMLAVHDEGGRNLLGARSDADGGFTLPDLPAATLSSTTPASSRDAKKLGAWKAVSRKP